MLCCYQRCRRGGQKPYLNNVLCLSQNKSTSTPTSPGPRTHSTPSIPVLTAGQSGLYSPQYISYIPQIHMGPAVQVRGETEQSGLRGWVGLLRTRSGLFRAFVSKLLSFVCVLFSRHLRCIHTLYPILCLDNRASTGEQKVSRVGSAGRWGCQVASWQMELELGTLSPTPGSLPPQRSDQHQPASAPPMMQAAAAAGPPLVAATPYSSYIPYTPQQFPGQPAMMQPMAHYPSQVTEAREGSRGMEWRILCSITQTQAPILAVVGPVARHRYCLRYRSHSVSWHGGCDKDSDAVHGFSGSRLYRPLLSLPLQPVFAPMLQSNPRMLTSGSHPQAIVSSSTPQYPSAEQPTPQALYGEFCALLLGPCSSAPSSVVGTDSLPLSCYSHCSPVLSTPCHAAPCPPAAASHHAYWKPAAVPACGPQSRPGVCRGRSEWLGREWVAGRGG